MKEDQHNGKLRDNLRNATDSLEFTIDESKNICGEENDVLRKSKE